MATLAPPPSPATPFLSSSHTLAHLLALPPLLLPLSPHLSSLHLARLRLLAALPSETTHLVCCSKCGALNVPGWTSSVEIGRGRQKTSSGATREGGVGASRKRKKAFNRIKTTCLVCGEVDCRPGSDKKTLESFPTTRRTRRQQQEEVERAQASAPPSVLASPGLLSGTSTPMDVDSPAASASSTPLASSDPTNNNSYFPPFPSTSGSNPASALSSPRLKHVPLSHPTVPSVAPPTPTTPDGTKEGAARKKKKKSGLQKMLALNKEKEEEELRKKKAGGGGGGLMDWMN